GTVKSSTRFKDEIRLMGQASEAILALNPVTFRYKQSLDPDGVLQFGLIAEQVEKVSPDLVIRDEDGKVSTVRYEAVNAMLLNEFLKEHREVKEQRAELTVEKMRCQERDTTVEKLRLLVAEQQKRIEALAATVEKVSATSPQAKARNHYLCNSNRKKEAVSLRILQRGGVAPIPRDLSRSAAIFTDRRALRDSYESVTTFLECDMLLDVGSGI